ncbi:DUF2927 domain-containing protein [Neotabrizicola sp. VNH66]|uniref:DUF2927 domain-containing protein n=1 Tax=Neotabrizicola sp. VNH66 TaxID=3400918 RepID=UPI003C0F3E16
MRKLPLLAAFLAATACAPAAQVQVTKATDRLPAAAPEAFSAPALAAEAFPGALPGHGGHSASEMAANFMELAFNLESGRPLATFSRFEKTITVALTGDVPATAAADLSRLIGRLRAEAGIDIRPAAPGEAAAVTIEFSPRSALRKAAPNAACFVVPNVTTLSDYRANKGSAQQDWANVAQRQKVGIFAPSDASAQEVRDCLHEELAQAIGPLNDLYRLSDSVFNDDNFHSVLTPFDMAILRAYYAPGLASGMSRAEVQSRISGIMAGIVASDGWGTPDLSATPRSWTQAIEGALGGKGSAGARRGAAERALAIAAAQGWRDGRMAFSHFALARLLVSTDRARAVEEFTRASAIYRGLPGGAVQVAHIDMQLAAIAVASGQPEQALRFADRALPVIRAAENHALAATVLLIRAEALDLLGRGAEAARARVDSQADARYGFGTEAQIRARTREIAALGARGSRG